MIVGYLNGSGEILEITQEGERCFHKQDAFAAIGTGLTHAKIAKYVIEEFCRHFVANPLIHNDDTFKFIISIPITRNSECGFPLEILKVSKEGVTKI